MPKCWNDKRLLSFSRQLNTEGIAYLDPKKVKIKELIGKSNKVEIPLRLVGPINNPKPDLDYTIQKLSKRLGKQELKKVEKKYKEKARKLLKKLKLKF